MQLKMEQYKFEQRMDSRSLKKQREEHDRERVRQSREKARKERIQRAFENYESVRLTLRHLEIRADSV